MRAGRTRGARALAPAPPARPAGVTAARASSSSTSTAPSSTPAATWPPPSTPRCAGSRPGTPPLAARRRALVHRQRRARLVARSLAHAGVAPARRRRCCPSSSRSTTAAPARRTRASIPACAEALDAPRATAPLAVLTNKPGDMSRAILDGLGVGRPLLPRSTAAATSPARKPDPGGPAPAAGGGRASRRGRRSMVGDSAIDVRTGRAAGVRTVGVTYGFDPDSLARRAPGRARRPTCAELAARLVVALARLTVLPLTGRSSAPWPTFSSGARRRDLIAGELPAGITDGRGRRRWPACRPRSRARAARWSSPTPPTSRPSATPSRPGCARAATAAPCSSACAEPADADDARPALPLPGRRPHQAGHRRRACACAWTAPSTPSTAGG